MDAMAISVSTASDADADELADVAAATFALACPPDADPADVAATIAEHLSARHFGDYLADPQRLVLAVRDAGAIVGYAMLIDDPGDRGRVELSKMYVAAGHHRTGAAAALMNAGLDWASRRGAHTVWLGVNRSNRRAQRFYRKHGFEVVGTRTFRLGSSLEDDYVMARTERSDAVRFTLPGDTGTLTDDDLRRLYQHPAAGPGRCVVRANAIASLDGAATVGGTSGGLGGEGDRRLFGVLREQADVILVGAGTVRLENYGGARATPIAVVTRSGHLERDLRVFTGSEVTPLVLTCTASAPGARARLGPAAEVIDCSGNDPDQVDLAAALHRLAGRGLTRVLTEGGPSLLGAFAERGLLDELCVTAAPLLVGGDAVRILAGGAETPTPMRCRHVLTDPEGYLYLRYTSV